jgi:hypothetical protein
MGKGVAKSKGRLRKPAPSDEGSESASVSSPDEEFQQPVDEEDIEEIASDEELDSDGAKDEQDALEEEANL